MDREGSKEGVTARRNPITGSIVVLAMIPAATVVLAELGGDHWIVDLARHFPLPSALSLWLAAGAMFLARRVRLGSVLAVLALVPSARLTPLWFCSPERPQAGQPGLRVALVNLLASNRTPERVAEWLLEEDPDVVALLEFTPSHEQALFRLKERWPHAVTKPVPSPFGIALFSKLPILDSAVRTLGASYAFAITATVSTGFGDVGLLAMHPPPPVSKERAAERDLAFSQLASAIASLPAHRVVLTDCNATRWSRPFRNGLAAAGLDDSCCGHGYQGSWPSSLPWFLRVPIDHVLVSGDLVVHHRELGGDVGSDHLPVLAEVHVRGRRE
ncbi:MAG: endonuclease/exonuclease/phosphatase family protein [Planctomycetota bacterium]